MISPMKHVRTLPARASNMLKYLYSHRGCRVAKNIPDPWGVAVTGDKVFVKLGPGLTCFLPDDYPLLSNALMAARLNALEPKNNNTVTIQCDAEVVPLVKQVTDNFNRFYSMDSKWIRVQGPRTNFADKNIVDFLLEDMDDFSVEFLQEQLRPDGADHSTPGVRLSHILDQFVDVLDLERAYNDSGCNVFLRSQGSTNLTNLNKGKYLHPLESQPVLEVIVNRGHVARPIFVEIPRRYEGPKQGRYKQKQLENSNFMASSPHEIFLLFVFRQLGDLEQISKEITTLNEQERLDIMTQDEETNRIQLVMKITENILSIVQGKGDNLPSDCLDVFKYTQSRNQKELDSLMLEKMERVFVTVSLPFKEGITLTELCSLGVERVSELTKTPLLNFARLAAEGSVLTCFTRTDSTKVISLDHKFTSNDIKLGRTVIYARQSKYIRCGLVVRWDDNC